jgi:hypothetical protein
MFVVQDRLVYRYYNKETRVCEGCGAVLAQHVSGPDCQPMKKHNMTILKDSDLWECDAVLRGE